MMGILYTFSYAQTADPHIAKMLYKRGNYAGAIKIYKKLLKTAPDDKQFNKYMGLCYLNSDIAPERSLDYLTAAYNLSTFKGVLSYYLAKAHTFHHQYDSATYFSGRYNSTIWWKHKKESKILYKKSLTANNFVANPIEVDIVNLGDSINTKFPEFYPYVIDSLLIFSGRIPKKGSASAEFDGLYQSDVFTANIHTKQQDIINFKKLNTSLDEQLCGVYGSNYYVYFDHITEYGDVKRFYMRKGYGYREDKKFDLLSDPKAIETSIFLTPDGNTMYYTSNSKDGRGGYDIFMRQKINSHWNEPVSININTEYDEGFPFLTEDGKTMYFCSNGIDGMGGFDLYKADWDESTNTWGEPENLGYPINTPSDEKFIWFVDKNTAYTSGYREDSYGYTDLYKIIFK